MPSCNSARICWAEGPIETLCSSKCRRVTADELIARNLALVRNGESRDKACAFEINQYTHMITYKLWLSKNGKHIKKRTYTADLNRWNTQFQWITVIFPTKMAGEYALFSGTPMCNQACVCVYIYIYTLYIYIHTIYIFIYIYVCFCQMDSLRFQYPTISNAGYPTHIPPLDQPIGSTHGKILVFSTAWASWEEHVHRVHPIWHYNSWDWEYNWWDLSWDYSGWVSWDFDGQPANLEDSMDQFNSCFYRFSCIFSHHQILGCVDGKTTVSSRSAKKQTRDDMKSIVCCCALTSG